MSSTDDAMLIAALMLGSSPHTTPSAAYEGKLGEWIERFNTNAKMAAYMTIARRSGLPLSEVRHRWSDDDDLLAELAWDVKLATDRAARCPDCGVHPDDQRDPVTKRALQEPVFMAQEFHCEICEEVAAVRRRIEGRDKNNPASTDGRTVRIVPWDPELEVPLDLGD